MKKKNQQKMQNLKKKTDLVFQFDFFDGLQIQHMFILLSKGYSVVDVSTASGVVEFRLNKKDK